MEPQHLQFLMKSFITVVFVIVLAATVLNIYDIHTVSIEEHGRSNIPQVCEITAINQIHATVERGFDAFCHNSSYMYTLFNKLNGVSEDFVFKGFGEEAPPFITADGKFRPPYYGDACHPLHKIGVTLTCYVSPYWHFGALRLTPTKDPREDHWQFIAGSVVLLIMTVYAWKDPM